MASVCGRARALVAAAVFLASSASAVEVRLAATAAAAESSALAAASSAASATSSVIHHALRAATFTQDAVCVANNCLNPVFPALSHFGKSVLSVHENRTWRCVSESTAWRDAGFCSKVIAGYEFSVPDAQEQDLARRATDKELIWEQSRLAMRAYVAHLTGMGRDFWLLTEPWREQDDCIQDVWRMACYTYFPRCNKLSSGSYLRPCASSCSNFLKSCKVRCCDEGAQCVFTHRRELPSGGFETEDGYADHSGPSPYCTGAAPRRADAPVGAAASVAALAALASLAASSAAPR